MGSLLSVRSEYQTRRTMVDSKAAYDQALNLVTRLEQRHASDIARLNSDYERMRTEVRGATRKAGQARRDGNRQDFDYWTAKVRRLNDKEMPPLLHQLGLRVDDIERANRVLASARVNVAIRAGIAPEYQHDIKIVNQLRGTFSIYFGGIGSPDGPGHAHYSFDHECECQYRREPTRQRPVAAWRR
jgi:outer membrane murein-binding lipoprotein Lpp